MTFGQKTADRAVRTAQADPSEGRLARDQLALALRYLRPHPWLMPVFGAAICLIFSQWIGWRTLAGWEIALTLSYVPFLAVARQFEKGSPESVDVRTWQALAAGTYGLSALVWVSQIYLLWAPGVSIGHLLIVLFLAGYLSGQSAFVGPSIPLAAALFLVDGTALSLVPLREGGTTGYTVSIICFLYAAYTLYMVRQVYLTARDMLLLRNDKNDLIIALGQAKAESDAARFRAEGASRSKSQFLANMSHELRTPLNAILGFSELIASRTFASDVEKHVEYAGLVHKSGTHLLSLINDVLDLAKIEAGGLVLQERHIDISPLIQEQIELMVSGAESGGVSLKAEIAPNLPLVLADERALKQVVINLLSNALKFTPRGGQIVVFARIETGAALAFGVSDTGVGIAPQDQARIFEDFGQGQHDVVTAEKGTGLGLPIVKGLIEAHGGRVTLESAVNKGTTVTVFLPTFRARTREAAAA